MGNGTGTAAFLLFRTGEKPVYGVSRWNTRVGDAQLELGGYGL